MKRSGFLQTIEILQQDKPHGAPVFLGHMARHWKVPDNFLTVHTYVPITFTFLSTDEINDVRT